MFEFFGSPAAVPYPLQVKPNKKAVDFFRSLFRFHIIILSCRIGASDRLGHAGDLQPGADDSLAGRVVDHSGILVLRLGPLPDFDLAATADDAHAHRREEVVRGVAVQVDSAVEDGRGVLADSAGDQGLTTRVVLNEVGDVVDHTGHGDEATAGLGLGDVVVPGDDGELLEGSAPVEADTLLVELLLHLLETAVEFIC